MNPFVVVMVALGVLFLLAVILLGIYYPGSGAEQVDWRPTRSAELEYQNEIDDLEQMQEAVNAKRRARGAGEITEAALRAEVAADLAHQVRHAESELVEQDIAEMLAVANARRERRGLAPLSRDELERELLGADPT